MNPSKVGAREKLNPNPGRQPRCFVGYRPPAKDGVGTWIARVRDEDSCKYRDKSLGDFGDLSGSERFAAAKSAVEEFAAEVESGGCREIEIETVVDACRAYRAKGNDRATLNRLVYGDPIINVKLDKLRWHHLEDWRGRLRRFYPTSLSVQLLMMVVHSSLCSLR